MLQNTEKRKHEFSIIVPAYNSEQFIRKGLESIVNQTFRDFELIVVCDSCMDRTEEVAKEYGALTKRVDYHHDGLTRNIGLKFAQGEWVLFMDDDDWYLHECCFEQLSEVLGRHDEDALMFSYIWKDYGYVTQTRENITSQLWCKCWRRKFLEENDIRCSILPNWSDRDFVSKAMRHMKRAVFWDMPIYYYNYMRPGSISDKAANGQIKRSL